MKHGTGFTWLLIWGVFIFSFCFDGCQKSSRNLYRHFAFVGIPAHPLPSSWDALKQSLHELKLMGADRIFVAGDWQSIKETSKQTGFESIELFLKDDERRLLTVPQLLSKKEQPGYYSFSTGENIFFVLDCEDTTENNYISQRQIQWLMAQKRKALRSSFSAVFLEKPLWQVEEFPGRNNWWSTVHPLLVDLNVKLICAGHFGHYQADVKKDGIQYIQSGGASSNLSENFYDLGNFPHFLWIAVSGDKFNVSPVPINTILPDTIVTVAQVESAQEAVQTFLSHPLFPLPGKPPRLLNRTVSIKITNPWSFPISGELTWQKSNADWRIYPPQVSYDLGAHQSQTSSFNVWKMNFRSVNRNLPFLQGELPPAPEYTSRPVKRYLIPHKKWVVNRTQQPVTIDGKLNEWVNTIPLQLDREYLTTGIADWNRDDLSVSVYSSWESEGLYFGIDIKDDRLFSLPEGRDIREGDCVELGFDCLNNKHVPGFDADDYHIGFSFTREGPVTYRWHGTDSQTLGRVYSCPFEIQRIPGHTIFELKIPGTELPKLILRKNTTFGFDVVVHDNDGSGWEGAMQWTAGLIPEIYPALFGEITLK